MPKNHLAQATSPYLLQHAQNPVDWHEWNDQALSLAKEYGRPILLSIGYSACHWCHVMAHESFEDPATAEIMNQLFVNIKVDREERPDLDKIYQTAHQLLSQRPGGWPLTVFLTPDDQTPFFAGTYFPDRPRHGLPSFRDLLRKIAAAYESQRQEISEQNQALLDAMSRLNPTASEHSGSLKSAPLVQARQQLGSSFDETHGGFGRAPKFPHPTSLTRLLRHWAGAASDGKQDPRALYVVDYTLTRMAQGGIFDQLGGGFCRYSVDDQWMIPHFEKMLYDNGPLLTLLAELWQISGKAVFKDAAEQTAGWVQREMQSPAGGYYSTLDADSEGEEGRFYTWTPEQARTELEVSEFRHLAMYYGLDRTPNFEGHWHLHTFASVAELNQSLGSSGEQARALLQSARSKLFARRERRVHPGRDEKILTAWNGLMIKGMARAGRIFGRADYVRSADHALEFIQDQLWREGRLLATHKDGRSRLAAYLDDYAYLLDALLELLQARWKSDDLRFAIALAEVVLRHFQDEAHGGFYFTANDHEHLIHRPKPYADDATPAGNGVAAFALSRLGHLLGEQRYLDAAERTLSNAWPQMEQAAHAYCSLLDTLEEWLHPPEIIVIRGPRSATDSWLARASNAYSPRRLCIAIPDVEEKLPGLLAARTPGEKIRAYICSGTSCEAPLEAFEDFNQRLQASEAHLG